MKAGAFPAFTLARVLDEGTGAGLLRMAKCGTSGRNEAYRSYVGLDRVGEVFSGAVARSSSVCKRGMNPGSMAVPPVIRIEDVIVLRRSSGTFEHGQWYNHRMGKSDSKP